MNGEKEKEKEEGRKASRATSNPNTKKNHLFVVISHTLIIGVTWKYQGRVVHKPASKRCVGGMVVLCRVDEKPLER